MDLIKLLNEFEAAVRADEFKGAGDPADVYWIEAEYADARQALLAALSLDRGGHSVGRLFTPTEIRTRVTWPRGTRFIQAL